MSYTFVSESEKAQIIAYYLMCQNVVKTAKEFNRQPKTVKRVVNNAGYSTAERKGNTSLCIKCKRAARFLEFPCPWASDFEEVPGWEAEKIEKEDSTAGTEWFYIKKCPLFMKEDKRRVSK